MIKEENACVGQLRQVVHRDSHDYFLLCYGANKSLRHTDIYGLAINYDTKSAKLVTLNVNVENNTSAIIVSEEPATYYLALCWLLNIITL